jgi:hypothetical protein
MPPKLPLYLVYPYKRRAGLRLFNLKESPEEFRLFYYKHGDHRQTNEAFLGIGRILVARLDYVPINNMTGFLDWSICLYSVPKVLVEEVRAAFTEEVVNRIHTWFSARRVETWLNVPHWVALELNRETGHMHFRAE